MSMHGAVRPQRDLLRANLRSVPILLAFAIGLPGCGNTARSGAESTATKKTGPAAANEKTPPAPVSDETRALLDLVPADAGFIGYIDSPESFWRMWMQSLAFAPEMQPHADALDQELKEFIFERIGLDFSAVRTVVAFNRGDSVALVASGLRGTLPGKTKATYRDTALVWLDEGDELLAAQRGDMVVIGDEEGIRATLDVQAKKAESLPAQGGALWQLVEQRCMRGAMAMAFTAEYVKDPEIQAQMAEQGVERACMQVGQTGVDFVAEGDGAKLSAFVEMVDMLIDATARELADERREATAADRDFEDGMAAIIAYHFFNGMTALFTPKVSGNRLELSVAAPEGNQAMLMAAVVGVLAAIAIPAFQKYVNKSKTAEADQFVKKIYDGARHHHITKGWLPPSVGPSPQAPCCPDKCQPDPSLWRDPAWIALQFSIDDPHYYSYEFINSGSEFTVRATGDLDCDGFFSTFEMIGTINQQGGIAGSAAMRRVDELE